MSLRSWAIRGLILGGVACVAAFAWVARSWVSPERVREQVIAHLADQFDGVDVHVGSAHLRLFGGIAVSDIRLTRRGADAPFLTVPSAVIAHDKEQLNRGRLVIKKVEFEAPELRLARDADGRWNVAGVLKPTPADQPVPTFVVTGGTVLVEDAGPDPLPSLALTNLQATVLNDPLAMLAVQASATAKGFGPLAVRGRMNRVTGAFSVGLEMPDFPLGEVAPVAADRLAPDLAIHLTGLTATAAVTATVSYTPGAPQEWVPDVRLEIRDAAFAHPKLPWPVEKIAATVHLKEDGKVRVEDATAQVNGAKVKLLLETVKFAPRRGGTTSGREAPGAKPPADPLRELEDHLERAEVTVAGVALDDALFKHLPEKATTLRRRFSPVGRVDVGYKFAREAAGWKRELEVRPKQVAGLYEKFRYPVADIRGWIKRTETPAGPPVTGIDLIGTAGGQPVTIKGTVTGDGDDPGIDLRITGENFPMDETLVKAFPPKYAELVRRFRATGRGGFVAQIVQQPGVNLCENEFRVDVRDATVNHAEFPYPLEKVKGRLVVRTTATDPARPVHPGGPAGPPPVRDEIVLDRFTAVHAGAAVWLSGSKRPIPNTRDEKLTLHVGGNSVPVDADVRAALAAVGIDSVWAKFNPSGRVTFAADLEVIDRAGPAGADGVGPKIDPTTDLKLTFNFSGPTVLPAFFPYELTDLAGWLEYKNGRVDVAHVAARHGETRVKVDAAEVRFYPDGAVWANVGALEMKPVVADAALIRALPGQLATAVGELKLKGGVELLVKHLVVLDPPAAVAVGGLSPPEGNPARPAAGSLAGAAAPTRQAPCSEPIVYWDAEVRLAGASFDTGVGWEQVFGAVATRGRYEGTHTGPVRGAVWFDRAVVARQPVTRLSARVAAAPQAPDPARPGEFLPAEVEVTDVNGDLFHGVLGGQARVVLADQPRYSLWLTATDVQLEEVAKHYKLGSDADLKGIAQAQLRLNNSPDPKTGRLVVEGSGTLDVPTGRMYNLPVLLDLVKVLKLQTPDKTAFDEAHATFRVRGDRVHVEQLDLIGKAVCLGGSGELDTSGEFVRFEFYTVLSEVLARMVGTPVGDLTAFLSKNLFVIKMTRENGVLRYRPEAVPLVTDPVRGVADRLRARWAKVFGGGK